MSEITNQIPCPSEFCGFSSWPELAKLVWECDIGTSSKLRKFLKWKRSDRSKSGLLSLGKRTDFHKVVK